MADCDIAIVGAGPYGLSAAAHLRGIKGLEVRVFGEPMSFWERHMPVGMRLRSPWDGSHIADPDGELTLDAFRTASGNHLGAPVPLARFIEYGRWFQSQAIPGLDRRKVTSVVLGNDGFQLTLEDGQALDSRRVVIAAGIAPFAWRPPEFSKLPGSLVSHLSGHRDLRRFGGRRVAVIGGGQSALESAALLHESGISVEVFVRSPIVHWAWRRPWLHTFKPVSALLYAPPDVGPAVISHIVARPNWFRRLPRLLQNRWGPLSIRPAGAGWLKHRLEGIDIWTGRTILSVLPVGEEVSIRFNDGRECRFDHVLLGTGYRVDISRYQFLSSSLLSAVRQCNGYPDLDYGFESSVEGLHFLGAPAAWSFGPLMRFVAGTEFSSRALTRRITSRSAKPSR